MWKKILLLYVPNHKPEDIISWMIWTNWWLLIEVIIMEICLTFCFSSQTLFKIRGIKRLHGVLIDTKVYFLPTFDAVKSNATVWNVDWNERFHRCGSSQPKLVFPMPVSIHLFHLWYMGLVLRIFLRKYKKVCVKS